MALAHHSHLLLMIFACMLVIALARPLSSGNMGSESMSTEEDIELKDDDDIGFYDSVNGRILENTTVDYHDGSANPRHDRGGNSKWGGGGGRPNGQP
ncbi:hypothetical protein SUGI_0888730 [Cryptomeria japonica]|nr:hypothetical protein SUGI_0888730 [Cryptomeria japonica]